MESALEKILNLAKKTGDNVIVFNPAKPRDSYVILALNSYERLVNEGFSGGFLTENDLDDKINPEITSWAGDDSWDDEDQDFLPEDILGPSAEPLPFTEAAEEGDEAEKTWEEEVNYLYPTEEEFSSLAQEESQQSGAGDFNSISDILESKRDKKNNWSIPAERQILED